MLRAYTNEQPCLYVHRVDGIVPDKLDLQYAGRVCDCGRVVFYAEPCGCPGNPHDEIRSKPNE